MILLSRVVPVVHLVCRVAHSLAASVVRHRLGVVASSAQRGGSSLGSAFHDRVVCSALRLQLGPDLCASAKWRRAMMSAVLKLWRLFSARGRGRERAGPGAQAVSAWVGVGAIPELLARVLQELRFQRGKRC